MYHTLRNAAYEMLPKNLHLKKKKQKPKDVSICTNRT